MSGPGGLTAGRRRIGPAGPAGPAGTAVVGAVAAGQPGCLKNAVTGQSLLYLRNSAVRRRMDMVGRGDARGQRPARTEK